MYVKIVQKVPVPPKVSVSLFDSYNNLIPTKSLHFFPRTLLLTTTLHYIKSEHHIFWEIGTDPSITKLMLIGDEDRPLRLVMFHVDEHKHHIYLHMHIPCTLQGIHQIKGTQFTESFTLIKIQTYNDKILDKCFQSIKAIAKQLPILKPVDFNKNEPVWVITDSS